MVVITQQKNVNGRTENTPSKNETVQMFGTPVIKINYIHCKLKNMFN
jgi:hypothetical protein